MKKETLNNSSHEMCKDVVKLLPLICTQLTVFKIIIEVDKYNSFRNLFLIQLYCYKSLLTLDIKP